MSDRSVAVGEVPVGAEAPPAGPPLFVDLDGTLVATDTLHEGMLLCLKRRPWLLPGVLLALATGGRAEVKRRLAHPAILPDAAVLPYREDLDAYLRAEKAKGRTLILTTASHRSMAQRVADHVGIFDAVLATDGNLNLRGAAKLRSIKELCADRGWPCFAYVGDSRADRPVWAEAGEAYVVAPPRSRLHAMRAGGGGARSFETSGTRLGPILRALRPHHWPKNVLVFLPLLLAHSWMVLEQLLLAFLAFVAFSLVASSVYVTNDLMDLDSDRRHPTKRHRPFASGAVPVAYGPAMAVGLLVGGLGLAWLALPAAFGACLLLYLLTTLAYSFWLKGRLLVDVFVLAGLYTLRVLAGGYATDTLISEWLMAFSGFIFLSLAFAKRYAELHRLKERREGARPSGRSYEVNDLAVIETVGPASGYLSVLVLALYISSDQVAAMYANPVGLWLVCPVLLYWITRLWFFARRGGLDEDPLVFAAGDSISLLSALVAAALVAMAAAGWGPTLPGVGEE